MNLSSLRVHYNSSKPAQLNALAYTQGQDIHVGPGQEKHLPHEGWHAVQQMQGRVNPTMQANGMSINDDADLEREADVMGAKALQMKRAEQATTGSAHRGSTSLQREMETKDQELGARVFMHGRDIYFGADQYTSKSREGKRLLIHGLTHVAQQGVIQSTSTLVQRQSFFEYVRELNKKRDSLRKAALELAKGSTKTERVLKFVGKWGRNASPFNIAMIYVHLNWKGVSYWIDVRKSAKAGRALLKRIDELELGARALKKATDEQYKAEKMLPSYPLRTYEEAGQIMVTNEELEYVEKYYNTSAMIANDAMATSSELRKAIVGWDAVVEQANKNNDFTRASAWNAIINLNLRFNNEGGDFRAYIVNARARANDVASSARSKQYHAADILGKWTPEGYQPPSGPF